MINIVLLLGMLVGGQELPNAQTLPAVTITCEKMPNLCPPVKGVVGIQQEKDKNGCTTWYDKDTGNEFKDCGSWSIISPGIRDPEKNGKLQVLRGVACASDCGTATIRKESGTYAFHVPPILNVGDVLKVFNYSIEPTCYVVANIDKKTKFVKIDCKELYD